MAQVKPWLDTVQTTIHQKCLPPVLPVAHPKISDAIHRNFLGCTNMKYFSIEQTKIKNGGGGACPSGGDKDFSHARVVGSGSACRCADGWQGQSVLGRLSGSYGQEMAGTSGRGWLALAFQACLRCSAAAVLLTSHIVEPL